MRIGLKAAVAAAALTMAIPVPHQAAGQPAASVPIPVVSYDISSSPRTGWGCWSHSYTGAMTNTGRTVSGSVFCTADGNQIADYSGGLGTINDGVADTAGIDNTHLLVMRNADDGQPIRPEITLWFAETVFVETIIVHGGDNIFSGAIDQATIRIGTIEATVTATPAGAPNAIGVPHDDLFDLTGTSLATVATTQVGLANFVTSFFGAPFDQLAVAEITVLGRVAATEVDIDIRPASARNVISLSSRIPVPIAVLSSSTFDIGTIDVETLTFGHSGGEDSLLGCIRLLDLNRDGIRDLLCLAATDRTGFVLGDNEGRLKGSTLNGAVVEGTDAVLIRP